MLIKEISYITELELERTLHIYLPDNYDESKKYGVVYMFDGHNLFVDEDATYGKSWGLKDYLESNDVEIIMVGIECNHEENKRLWEFSPYSFYDRVFGSVTGQGDIIYKWIVEELKPYIDNKYSTNPSREYTAVGGSSMGGLMALYGGIKHYDVFSKAICISPHFKRSFNKLLHDVSTSKAKKVDFYISYGNYECHFQKGLAIYTERVLNIIRYIQKDNNVYPHLYVNQDHSEGSWEKENDIWMEELGIKSW